MRPTRRKAIDQAVLNTWRDGDRKHRIKLAKAYLMDAVQQQSGDSDQFSMRVQEGLNLLTKALSQHEPCAACKGSGKVKEAS